MNEELAQSGMVGGGVELDVVVMDAESVLTGLDQEITKRFTAAKEARAVIEKEMLEDMYRRDGVYSPGVLAELTAAGGSRAFDNVTESKCAGAQALLENMLLFSKMPIWGLKPTPVPELGAWAREAAVERVAASDMAQDIPPEEDEAFAEKADALAKAIEMEERREAGERACRMERLIDDALTEVNFRRELKDVLYDFVTHRVAGFMGPIPRVKKVTAFGEDGRVHFVDKLVLEVERVSPFEVYPAALSSSPEHGDFFIRKLISDDDAAAYGGMENLLPGRYEAAMKRKGNKVYGDNTLDDTLSKMQKRNDGTDASHTPDGIHELIYFWHWMTLREIAEGRREEYDEADVESNVRIPMMGVMLNGVVITLEKNWDETGKPQVHLCSFREKPDSVFGLGVAGLMRDKQAFTNIMTRSCLDNAVMSAHPSYIANADRFDDFADLFLQHPGKVYAARSPTMPDDKTPALEPLPTANYTPMFLQARDKMDAFAEDATGIYRQSYGSPLQNGPAETKGGYKMLLEAQTGIMKVAVANLSQAIESLVYHYWLWFMLADGHEDCKGDMRVEPRGAVQLFITEEDSEMLMTILQIFTSNDRLLATLKPEGIVRLARRLLALRRENPDDYVMSDEEVRAEIERQKQEAAQQQMMMQQMQMQQQQGGEGTNEYNLQVAQMANATANRRVDIEQMKAQAKIENDREELAMKRAKIVAEIQAVQAKRAAAQMKAAREARPEPEPVAEQVPEAPVEEVPAEEQPVI